MKIRTLLMAGLLGAMLTTLAQQPMGPVVQTKPVTDIGQTMANSGGNIPNDGGNFILSKGLVWGTQPDPTTLVYVGIEAAGTGIGEFDVTMTGLTPGTTYYVRAFGVDASGTYYGNEEVFTTLPLSVEEFEKTSMIYPNPVHGEIKLQMELPENSRWSIIDLQGRECASDFLVKGTIPVASLPTGIYILIVKNEEEMLIHERFHKN